MSDDPNQEERKHIFGLTDAEIADVKTMLRYGFTIASVVGTTLLIVMFASYLYYNF